MATISNFTCDDNGNCTWLNPGAPANPLLITVIDSTSGNVVWATTLPATATSYSIPTADFAAGDTVQLQRIVVDNTFTTTIPADPPPPPVNPTVTQAAASVNGTTVTVTAACSSDVTAATLQDGSAAPVAAAPANGVLKWTLTGEAAGAHTYTLVVANAAGLTATVTVIATVVVTPPPSGNPVAQFFTPGDAFNIPIPANPVLDPNNAAWVKLINESAATSGADLATQSDAWPVFQALPTDPVVTVSGVYQNATLHLPQGCKPQTPVGGDAHMFVISPDGTRVTEMGGVVLSGTWPNQTVKVGNGSSPCQFVISTAAGNTTTNIAGDGTVDGNPSHVGSPGSERGCAICCIAGLVMEAEFLAALAVENAGGQGLIPHALAATAPFTAGAPYVAAAKNTGAAGQPRLPALISDGGTSGGIPESARIQLKPSTDISGLSPSLRVIARTMQVHGWFLTDSTNTAIAFQGQAATVANTAWSAFEQGGSLAALPWADMQVLKSWNGT